MQHGRGGAYEMYIQTPWGEGSRPGGTEQGRGSISPLAGRGALGQSLRVAPPQGEGTAATTASVLPTQTGEAAEQGGQGPGSQDGVSTPVLNSGARKLLCIKYRQT